MADFGTASFAPLFYTPGNPEFPTLPDGVQSVHIIDFGSVAGLAARGPVTDVLQKFSVPTGNRFGQWFLDGTWITPQPVNFGAISATVQRTVNIHNTRRTAITITSIDASAVPGISVVSPSLPETIPAFESLLIVLEAAETGADDFDGYIDLVTSEGTLPIRVIGQRILAFPIHPEGGINEQLQFRTGLLRSKNGTEQAMGTRITPRRKLRVTLEFQDDAERSRTTAILMGRPSTLLFSVPQFQEAREITESALSTATTVYVDTTSATFEAGRKAHFRLPDDSTVDSDIQEVQSDRLILENPVGVALPVRTYCMPSYLGRVTTEPQLGISAVNDEQMTIEFTHWDTTTIGTTVPDILTTPHPVDSLPILTAYNAMNGRRKRANIDRGDEITDNNTGPIFSSTNEVIGEFSSRFQSTARNMAQIFAWREFAHYVFGSWRKFYIPSYQNDLPAAVQLSINATSMDVPNMGISRFLNGQVPRRDVRVEYPGGVEYTRIASVTDNGSLERIGFNPALTNSAIVQPEDLRVSWLNLVRVSGDVFNFRHEYLGRAQVSFNFRSVIE